MFHFLSINPNNTHLCEYFCAHQMEDQKLMLTQQSEQLRHLHEEKQIAQQLVEKFQHNMADLENSVRVAEGGSP